MSTSIGRDFTSFIPSLSDDANIQEAFRMYHFGTQDGSEPAPADPVNGIEGYLADLQLQIDNITAGADIVSDLGNAVDLNSVITSGTYRRSSAPTTGLNYPELSPGLLIVIAATSTVIYQIYQTLGGSSGTNHYYWRGRDAGGSWSAWAQSSKTGHNHDSLYYQKAEIDARINSQASLAANSVVVTDGTKKISTSSLISTTELEYLNGVGSNVQEQLNNKAALDHNHDGVYHKIGVQPKIFVQSSQPSSGVQVNDLWFW
jgi:hypothetical protein